MTRTVAAGLAVLLACSGVGAGGAQTSRSPRQPVAADSEPMFTFVSAGGTMTCALTGGGRAYCWGSDSAGQLGDGTRQGYLRNPVPLAVAGNHTFAAISAGNEHVCALTAEGAAYCWGLNSDGALGSDTAAGQQPVPTPVAGNLRFAAISAGWDRTCAVALDGTGYCWGRYSVPSNDAVGRSAAVPTRVPGTRRFRSIAAGLGHACGIGQDNQVYCWGRNDFGELGQGSTHLSLENQVPGQATLTMPVTSVSVSLSTSCVVTLDGVAYCWGSNRFGTLGNGASTDEYTATVTPSRVPGDHRWRQISAQSGYTCAVAAAGAAYCWGLSADGPARLLGSDSATERCGAGPGSSLCSTRPLPVAGGLRFHQVSAGSPHACGVTELGQIYCWGGNRHGELGNGSLKPSVEPARVVFPAPGGGAPP